MCLILVKRCQMNTENSVSDKHCTIWRTNAKECNIVQHSTNQTCTNVVDMKRYRLLMQIMKPHTHKRPNGFSKMRWPVQKYQISHAGPKFLCTPVRGYRARHFNKFVARREVHVDYEHGQHYS